MMNEDLVVAIVTCSTATPSGQAWKCNFIKAEKADPSIINMTIFQRNAHEIVFRCFQFNP
jgi:hypothetical protein